MAGCGEGSFLIGLDFHTGSTFEQAGLCIFNVCRISRLDILITNHDSGLRGKHSRVRFLCNEHKNGHKIHSMHAYMLMLMSSRAHKLLMLKLVLMLASLVRTRL